MSGLLLMALLMVVVSGLIAYIGDLIGRKMGRKRLTLFGLRPRHTAIVISIAAGMIIAIFTFAAAFIVSKPVRDAFIKPRETLQTEIDQLNIRLTKEKNKLSNAEKQSTEAMKQAEEAQKQLAGVSEELETRQKLIDEKKRQLAKVEDNLRQSKKELQASEQEVTASHNKLVGEGKKLLDLQTEYKNLDAQLEKLQNEIKALDPFLIANFSPLAFASGQEIVSGLIPAKGGNANTRREQLRAFIKTAERIVHQQCELKPGENAIVFLRVEGDKITKLNDNETVELLSARLARVTDARDAIVRLAPANNVPVNGQAFIVVNDANITNAVQVIPNTQVYEAGDEVARVELTVTPQHSTGEILTRLVDDLLREKVPDELRKKEVLLILRRFDPARPVVLPGASPSLVSWSDLAAATEQARMLTGKVSIVARSNKAMNRFDPLSLTLEVAKSD
jgi:hypothetical protein